jgi:hypothetical protein
MFAKILLLTSVILCAAAAFAAASSPDTIAAVVNGDTIGFSTIEMELVHLHNAAQGGEMQLKGFDVERLVQKLINDRLLAQDARNLGLDQDSSVISDVTDYHESIAVRALIAKVIPDTFMASAADVRAQYQEDFRTYDLQLISVSDSLRAAQIADSIRAGVPMDSLALRNSVDTYLTKAGHAGAQPLYAAPPLAQPLLRSAKTGDVLGPLNLWQLHTIIRVNGITEADPSQLDSVRSFVEPRVIRRRQEEALQQLVDRLRHTTPVSIDSAQIDTLFECLRASREVPDVPVVRVGMSRVLTLPALRRKFLFRMGQQRDRDVHVVLGETVDDNVRAMLLREAAVREQFDRSPSVASRVKAFEDSVLVLAYLRDIIAPTAVATDSAVAAYYREHAKSFHKPDRVLTATLTRATLAEAKEDFEALQSGSEFAWLARRHSLDEAKDKGGLRDWLRADQLPPKLRATLDSLQIGAVTSPLPADTVFMIVQLVNRKVGEAEPLTAVAARIRQTLQQRGQLDAINRTITELRKNAKLDLHHDVIKSLKITGTHE